jgi:hypothetical protein
VSGKTLGTDGNDFLAIRLWFDAGSSFDSRTNTLGQQSGTFDLARLQVEKGPDATGYEDRPNPIEHDLVRRYYQARYNLTMFCLEQTTISNTYRSPVRYPVSMRATPTVTMYGASESGGGFNGITDSSLSLNVNRSDGFKWQVVSTGTDTSGVCAVYMNWKADAELYES